MKRTLLTAALLCTAASFAQNTTVPSSSGGYGTNNVAVGHQAADNSFNVSSRNVSVGFQAGMDLTNGFDNVFNGYQAGFETKGGYYNIFLGSMAGKENITGANSIFIGYQAGKNSNANYNVFVGGGAGLVNTSGHHSTYLGGSAGSNSTGSYNTFLGASAGINNGGSNNVMIGADAGSASTGQSGNVIIGHTAGLNSPSNNGIIIGAQAGQNAGARNVLIGFKAGNVTTGTDNVMIGNQAGEYESGSKKLYISNTSTSDPLIYGDFDTSILKFNAAKVGIGNPFGSFPSISGLNGVTYKLFVKGGILAEEVRVRVQSWPDYVFKEDYSLMPLTQVERYIADEGHLPNMPSACEVEEQGLDLGNIVKLQQEKIEELTLHLIEQNKQLEELKQQVQILLKKE